MNDQSILVLYQALRYLCTRYPETEGEPCKSPKSFAVVSDFQEVNTENLAKTVKDSKYFWSKRYHETGSKLSGITFDYPKVLALPHNGNLYLNNKPPSRAYNVDILVIDKYDEQCAEGHGNCIPCKKRTKEEIFNDTNNIAVALLRKLRSIYAYNPRGSEVTFTLTEPVPGDQYVMDAFNKMLSDSIKNMEEIYVEDWNGTDNHVYGTLLSLSFKLPVCPIPVFTDGTEKDVKEQPDGCC